MVGWLVALGVGAASALVALRHRLWPRVIDRRMQAFAQVALAALPDDQYGKVVAQVASHAKLLTSPLTGRPCVAYVVSVEERLADGWFERIGEQALVPFQLVDGDARALVEGEHVDLALRFDHQFESAPSQALPAAHQAFIKQFSFGMYRWHGGLSVRCREAVITVGETVAVLGQGVREPDPTRYQAGLYRDHAAPTWLRICSTKQFPVTISNEPKHVS